MHSNSLHPWGAGCQEHLEMIWSLVRLKVVTSWKPSWQRCVIFIAERCKLQQTKDTTVQCANRPHFAESLAFVNHLNACGACAPIHDFVHYVCITLANAAAERGHPPLEVKGISAIISFVSTICTDFLHRNEATTSHLLITNPGGHGITGSAGKFSSRIRGSHLGGQDTRSPEFTIKIFQVKRKHKNT